MRIRVDGPIDRRVWGRRGRGLALNRSIGKRAYVLGATILGFGSGGGVLGRPVWSDRLEKKRRSETGGESVPPFTSVTT
jgi:hypothetical protein